MTKLIDSSECIKLYAKTLDSIFILFNLYYNSCVLALSQLLQIRKLKL